MSMMRRIAALSDQTKIASVSAACLIALTVVLKNVVQVPADVLSRDIIIYIVIYPVFWMLPALDARREKKSRLDGALPWSLLIVAITAAIITLYAI